MSLPCTICSAACARKCQRRDVFGLQIKSGERGDTKRHLRSSSVRLCIRTRLAKLRSLLGESKNSNNAHKRPVIGRQLASGASRYTGGAVIRKTFPV